MAKRFCLNYAMVLVVLLYVSDISQIFSTGNSTWLQQYDYYNYYYYDYLEYYQNFSYNELTTIHSNAVENVLPRLANICPGLMMSDNYEIQRSTLSNSKDASWSCCKQCSTDPNCHTTHGYNHCCPHSEMALNWLGDQAECKSALLSSHTEIQTSLEYMTVLNCKNVSGVYASERNTSFDDIVMVHSRGVLYRNKYVAMCNGIKEYDRWLLLATGCNYPLLKKITQETELMDIVLSNCLVYSAPPPDFDSSPFVCYDFHRMISYCNKTGLWDKTDKDIRFLCQYSSDSPAFDTDGAIYFNIFCLACNKPSNYLKTPKKCERSWSHKSPTVGEIHILNTDNYQSNEQTDNTCDSTFVLDIYQIKCRPLLCPSPKQPFKGRCLQVTEDKPQVLQVILRLSPPDWILGMDTTAITPENHLANNERILSHVGLIGKCRVQGNYMFSYTSRNKQKVADFIIYDLRLYSSSTCIESISSLRPNKHKWTIKNFSLETGPTSVDATVQITIPFKYNQHDLLVGNISSYAEKCKTCEEIKTIIPLDCPYVKLLPTELCYAYKINNEGDITACSDFFTSDGFKDDFVIGDDLIDGDWNTVYYICVHHYNNLFLSTKLLYETDQGDFQKSDSTAIILNSALYICAAFLLL